MVSADTRVTAPALGMPKITVSSKVAELEEHWGVQLLQRTTRTLALTDAGAAFVEVTVQLTDRQVDLVAERFDVAIRAGELPDSTLVGKLIGMAEHRVVASPEYLAQRGTPTRPADLTTHACLCFARSGTPVRTTWPFRSGNRSLDVPVSGGLVSDDFVVLRTAAEHGVGAQRMPSRTRAFMDFAYPRLVQALRPAPASAQRAG